MWNDPDPPSNPYDQNYQYLQWKNWELCEGFKNPNAINPFDRSYRAIIHRRWQEAYDRYHNAKPKKESDMTNANQLYKIKDKEQYVKRLASNSKGEEVVEDASTGAIFAVAKADLELVVPYSVGVRFTTGAQVYHYLATVGSVEKGDVLIKTENGVLSFASVVEIDTKSFAANAELKGTFRKLKSEAL